MNLQDIRQSIEDDIEAGIPVEILSDDASGIRVFDETEMGREYTLHDPSGIYASWLAARTIETPCAAALPYRVDTNSLASYLAANVAPEYMMTLESIVILGDDYDEDYSYLRGIGDFYYELEGSELPVDELGLHWYSYNKVFVHMGNVIDAVNGEYENMRIDENEVLPEINLNVLITLVHEIMHLAQANPYIPDGVLMQRGDDEADAEDYARRVVEVFPPMVTYKA